MLVIPPGYGFNDGMFIFTTNFLKNRDYVVVFPTEPKEFEDNPGFTTTATTRPLVLLLYSLLR